MPRMRILSASEQESFDKPPLFDFRERKKFLEPSRALLDAARGMRDPHRQIGFALSCGHFRATRRYFASADFRDRDLAYVATQLGLEVGFPLAYPDRTRQRHQRRILDLYGFSPFDSKSERAMAVEIATMARAHLKPRLTFDRCVDFLVQRRVQVPGSGVILEQIRSGLHVRKAEPIALMDARLANDARELLDGLFTTAEDRNLCRLTLLKRLSQSARPTKIEEAIADFETLAGLHDRLRGVLAALEPGVAGIRCHAGSVLRSEMFRIQRREDNDRHIHAAAFVAHQFHRSQDNLIDLWLSVMAAFQATVTRGHNEHLLQSRKKQQEHLKAVFDDLDTSVFGLIRDIRDVTEADGLSDAQKVADIRAPLDRGQSSAFELLKDDPAATGQDRSWFDMLEAQSLRSQNRLSPILHGSIPVGGRIVRQAREAAIVRHRYSPVIAREQDASPPER